jgi:hypothetical protein
MEVDFVTSVDSGSGTGEGVCNVVAVHVVGNGYGSCGSTK